MKQTFRTTASHLVSVKWADGSDVLAVPQCLEHHPQSTEQARQLLVESGIDVPSLHQRLWKGFMAERGHFVESVTQEEFEMYLREKGFVEKPFSRRKNR